MHVAAPGSTLETADLDHAPADRDLFVAAARHRWRARVPEHQRARRRTARTARADEREPADRWKPGDVKSIILVDPNDFVYADGGVEVTLSNQTTLELRRRSDRRDRYPGCNDEVDGFAVSK